jgi:predicted alpha/beta hydrolase family esterase
VSPFRLASIPNPALVLPGYGGSGPAHWQTLWERSHPGFTRVEERDWAAPDRAEWVAALDAAIQRSGPGTVLVAHSLACLQVAHWVAWAEGQDDGAVPGGRTSLVRAALLVAPPDPAGPEFPDAATGFAPVPAVAFPFPALVVGSTNDPYAAPGFTEACARAWNARLVSVGPQGHVNAASGLGEWEEGQELLLSLLR